MVAGGRWQVPLIRFLQEKGHQVHVIDPQATAPGAQSADRHLSADVRNLNQIQELIQNTCYEMVLTDQSDISVDTVLAIAQWLGLRHNPSKAIQRFRNKLVMREYAREIGMPIPAFRRVSKRSELTDCIQELGLPLIIKPPDAQSSRGVGILDREDLELQNQLLEEALRQTELGYVVAEEYISGLEITVEGIAAGGQHRSLACSSKSHFRPGVASSLCYPAEISEEMRRNIETYNDRFVAKSGLEYGITHAEYLVDEANGNFYLVEIACRGGGTLISSDIINWVTGLDVYELFYQILQGESVDVNQLKPIRRHALLQFFEFEGGQIQAISGLESARKVPGVAYLDLECAVGDVLKPAIDDRSRHGFVILYAESVESLQIRAAEVLSHIKISYTQDEVLIVKQ